MEGWTICCDQYQSKHFRVGANHIELYTYNYHIMSYHIFAYTWHSCDIWVCEPPLRGFQCPFWSVTCVFSDLGFETPQQKSSKLICHEESCFNWFCFSICSHKETHKCPLKMRICHIFKKEIRAENSLWKLKQPLQDVSFFPRIFGYNPDTRNGGNIRIPEVAPKNTENNHSEPLISIVGFPRLLTFQGVVFYICFWWLIFSTQKVEGVCVCVCVFPNAFRKHQLWGGFDSAKVMKVDFQVSHEKNPAILSSYAGRWMTGSL